MVDIEANCRALRRELPDHVGIVAAAKSRSIAEVRAALQAGITLIGHNYIQEAEPMVAALGTQAQWHLIGHLQKNKAKKAVPLFDLIETVDSWPLAELIERRGALLGKTMPVLVEMNSAEEPNKSGVLPAELDELVRRIADLAHLRVQGLMTMGPALPDPEALRPFFRNTRAAFDRLADARLPGLEMKYLSMGMSDSYLVAVEEGSNLVRIGTKLFGPRS